MCRLMWASAWPKCPYGLMQAAPWLPWMRRHSPKIKTIKGTDAWAQSGPMDRPNWIHGVAYLDTWAQSGPGGRPSWIQGPAYLDTWAQSGPVSHPSWTHGPKVGQWAIRAGYIGPGIWIYGLKVGQWAIIECHLLFIKYCFKFGIQLLVYIL